jgi:hypothetical protein
MLNSAGIAVSRAAADDDDDNHNDNDNSADADDSYTHGHRMEIRALNAAQRCCFTTAPAMQPRSNTFATGSTKMPVRSWGRMARRRLQSA